MTQNEKYLSNLSYTNKDFNSIYPELLNLVKSISYRWDPTISDESDPGVVLLKLAALMADKNNYNIDKNILELFPLSVTQLHNAREIFDQCGYYMKHYQSARADVVFRMTTEPEITQESRLELVGNASEEIELADRVYIIPKFTMISDVDNKVVYTLTKEVEISSSGDASETVEALQGTINVYSVNGQTNITSAYIDYNRRLYFQGIDIPENGIFITNTDSTEEWKKVDNLLIQPVGSKCFKFGLTKDGTSCYVEFPTDIDSLIEGGLSIHYLKTAGSQGMVASRVLKQFYKDTTCKRYIPLSNKGLGVPVDVLLTAENVYISNISATVGGADPETIDEAYRNYERIKTTFDTLVSLRDYSNFLYTNKNTSNVFVCDRTNDIQSSYQIMETEGNQLKYHTVVKQETVTRQLEGTDENNNSVSVILSEKVDELEAFDLRVYGLQYQPSMTTLKNLESSFNLIVPHEINTSKRINPNQKEFDVDWQGILNDVEDIKSIQHRFRKFYNYRPLLIKNKFPIIARIVPQYRLTALEQTTILNNVIQNLIKLLNSRQVEFGEKADYDAIYDTILNTDTRIKSVVLDDIKYETYVVYAKEINGKQEIAELRIDTNNPEYVYIEHNEPVIPDGSYVDLTQVFRDDIFVKSVLAGKTQFLEPAYPFEFSLFQSEGVIQNGIHAITTRTEIPASVSNLTESTVEFQTDALLENESIIFEAPHYIEENTYGNYIKFLHNIGGSPIDYESKESTIVNKNGLYKLKNSDGNPEYIVFFWKDEDNDDLPYNYKLITQKSGLFISPTFSLKQQKELELSGDQTTTVGPVRFILEKVFKDIANEAENTNGVATGTTKSLVWKDTTSSLTDGRNHWSDVTEFISYLRGSNFVLSGTNQIQTKKINRIKISAKTPMYWITRKFDTTDDTRYSMLFDKDQSSYTLGEGEYFLYANETQTQLSILESGTLITRDVSRDSSRWSVPYIEYGEVYTEGPAFMRDKWVRKLTTLELTEMEFIQLGEGSRLFVTPRSDKIKIDVSNPTNSASQKSNSQEIEIDTISIEQVRFKHDGMYLRAPKDKNSYYEDTFSHLNTSDFSILYRTLEDPSDHYLPDRPGDGIDDGWSVRTSLSINVSPQTTQTLTANQKFICYDEQFAEIGEVSDVTLLSSHEVVLRGGNYVDVTTESFVSPESRIPLQLYHFKEIDISSLVDDQSVSSEGTDIILSPDLTQDGQLVVEQTDTVLKLSRRPKDSSEDSSVTYSAEVSGNMLTFSPSNSLYEKLSFSNGTCIIKTDGDDTDIHSAQYSIDIDLPEGKYILPIVVETETYMCVQYPSESAAAFRWFGIPLNERPLNEKPLVLTRPGTYYLGYEKKANDSSTTITISFVSYLSATANPVVRLRAPYSYTDEKYKTQDEFDRFVKYMNSLDPDGWFDYTYVIPDEDLVKDPLDSNSFFDKNHIYNSFTISQWKRTSTEDLTADDIKILNKVK